MTASDRLRDALAAHDCNPRGTAARCPAHDDRAASLSVGPATHFAGVLANCHAGCSVDDILAALGLTRSDLFDEPSQAKQGSAVVAEYPYHDETGKVLWVKERRWPKDFRQYVPQPDGGKQWSHNGVRRVLYRLPEVKAAIAESRSVFVVEGEKDADALHAAGKTATCNTEGAAKSNQQPKWRKEYTEQLRGAIVTVVADKDDAGMAHAKHIVMELTGVAAHVCLVEPVSGKDAYDHLQAGWRVDDFVEVCDQLHAKPQPSHEFWEARQSLRHIQDFARARRVGPWALLGCVLVRVIAAVPPSLVLPALVGGQASLNLFAGIVSGSGGGKGTAEAAALDAIDLPYVPILGPGSGEGIGHLFYAWDKTRQEMMQHTVAVILSAAEIDTLSALKSRQASTLFPELRKAWMGGPLGFAYVDKEKRLTVPRHSYRLCLSVGIQPANAAPILDDHSAGTPQRFLWFPADDPDAPDERPEQPEKWRNPLIQIGTFRDRHKRQELAVCETTRAEIDTARLDRLRGSTSEALDGHALLAQLKAAAALALLDGRRNAISEGDWRLAAIVRQVSDQTRQQVIDALERTRSRTTGPAPMPRPTGQSWSTTGWPRQLLSESAGRSCGSWTTRMTGFSAHLCGAAWRPETATTSRMQSRRSSSQDRLRNAR